MWALFKNICMKSGIAGFWLILSSCGGKNDSLGQNQADIVNNIVFSIKRTVQAELLAPYSIEDQVIFASRQDRDLRVHKKYNCVVLLLPLF